MKGRELSQPDPHPVDNAGIPDIRFSRPRDGMRRGPRPMGRGGKLVNQIDVVEGIENTPAAFKRLFTGENLGKQLVRLR